MRFLHRHQWHLKITGLQEESPVTDKDGEDCVKSHPRSTLVKPITLRTAECTLYSQGFYNRRLTRVRYLHCSIGYGTLLLLHVTLVFTPYDNFNLTRILRTHTRTGTPHIYLLILGYYNKNMQ